MREPTAKQRQSRATQQRLLDAAFAEFQEHGLAGARVDRIAARAQANKRLIYVYFGDKEGLFDAVVTRDVEAMIDAVPFTADDLAAYAVALLGYVEARPQVLRLFAWRGLERADASELERASYAGKVAAIAEAQADGRVGDRVPAAELLAFLLALVQSWAIASPALQLDGAARAARLREAVRALAQPPAGLARSPE